MPPTSASPADANVFLSHLTSAALIVYGIQWLKKFRWYCRLIDKLPIAETDMHRLVAMLGATITAIGIHYAVTGDTGHGFNISVAIPPLHELAHAAWDWLHQFALQQIMYDALGQHAGPQSNEVKG